MNWLAPHDPVSAWTHGLWMLAAIPAGFVLVWKNRGDPGRMIATSLFAVSLAVCFGSSAFFHAAPEGSLRTRLNLFDHLGIYLLIAGSATPIAVIALRGWWRRWLLLQIWALAAAGAVLRVAVVLPQPATTALYLAMGWVGVVTYFELASRLSHAALRPLWAGGLCYTVGAVCETWGLAGPVAGRVRPSRVVSSVGDGRRRLPLLFHAGGVDAVSAAGRNGSHNGRYISGRRWATRSSSYSPGILTSRLLAGDGGVDRPP